MLKIKAPTQPKLFVKILPEQNGFELELENQTKDGLEVVLVSTETMKQFQIFNGWTVTVTFKEGDKDDE